MKRFLITLILAIAANTAILRADVVVTPLDSDTAQTVQPGDSNIVALKFKAENKGKANQVLKSLKATFQGNAKAIIPSSVRLLVNLAEDDLQAALDSAVGKSTEPGNKGYVKFEGKPLQTLFAGHVFYFYLVFDVGHWTQPGQRLTFRLTDASDLQITGERTLDFPALWEGDFTVK